MPITLMSNCLEGKYATPKNHPVTCANPAPWKITQMKIENGYDGELMDPSIKCFIRGEGSMWFRADQCWIEDAKDVAHKLCPQCGKPLVPCRCNEDVL